MYKLLLEALMLTGTTYSLKARCVFEGVGSGQVTGEILLNHDGVKTE